MLNISNVVAGKTLTLTVRMRVGKVTREEILNARRKLMEVSGVRSVLADEITTFGENMPDLTKEEIQILRAGMCV